MRRTFRQMSQGMSHYHIMVYCVAQVRLPVNSSLLHY